MGVLGGAIQCKQNFNHGELQKPLTAKPAERRRRERGENAERFTAKDAKSAKKTNR